MPTGQDLDNLRSQITRLERVVDRMDETYARRDVIQPRLEDLAKDISALESFRDWAVKIVLALVIAAMFGALLWQNVQGAA